MITLSIDVTLLDKARFKRITRKNGTPAVFADLILIPTPDSEFGDYAVKQSVTKAEREEGVQLPFLGNGKEVSSVAKAAKAVKTHVEKQQDEDGDEIPF
jgi:hypothetical protein